MFNKVVLYGDFKQVKDKFAEWMHHGVKTNGYFRYYPFCVGLDAYEISREELLGWLGEADTLRAFLDVFIQTALRRTEAAIFAEKTPSNAYCFPEILQLFPRAKVIHLYRDGRDVICSLRRRGFSWFQASSMWLYNTVAALQSADDEQYYSLAYEDLVSHPGEEIRKLCQFLRIDYYPEMLETRQAERLSMGEASTSWSLNPTANRISTSAVGRHRADLTSVGATAFRRICLSRNAMERLSTNLRTPVDVMESLGYPTDLPFADTVFSQLELFRELVADRLYRHLQSLKRLESPEIPFTTLRMVS